MDWKDMDKEQIDVLENNYEGNYAEEKDDEYAFGTDIKFVINPLTHDVHSKTNQGLGKNSKTACTIVGAVNQLIRLFGLEGTMNEHQTRMEEAIEYCRQFGYNPGYGWVTPTALEAVVKRWNNVGYVKFNKEKVFFIRTEWNDPRVREALDKGHYVGFTYNLNYGKDRYAGIIDKPSYPRARGHRTNWRDAKTMTATSGVKCDSCDVGVHDSYHGWTNEYFIKDRSKYINKGMYSSAYLVLPESWSGKAVEDLKKENREKKAVNALIGMLSTTYSDMPEDIKPLLADLAGTLREKFNGARELIKEEDKKAYQMVVDTLSFAYRFADEKFKTAYANLAKIIRNDKEVL